MQQMEAIKGMLIKKKTILCKTDGSRVMSGNLNIKSRCIINVKQAQAHESTHPANVHVVNTSINNNYTLMTTNYQKYV